MHSFGRLHLINLWPHQKNSLSLFKYQTPKEKSKQAGKIATLKADVSLFSQLYIVKTDVGTFFQHENNPYIIPTISFRQRKTAPGQKVRLTEVSDTSTWYTHSRFTWDTRPWWWHWSGSLSSAWGRGGQLSWKTGCCRAWCRSTFFHWADTSIRAAWPPEYFRHKDSGWHCRFTFSPDCWNLNVF